VNPIDLDFFMMQYIRTRSSSMRTEWLLPLGVIIQDTMKVMLISFSFMPPTEKPFTLD